MQKILEIPDLTKNEIYNKSHEWMAKTFVSYSKVIQLSDEETGKIIGKGITYFTSVVVDIPVEYTLTIETKQNRIRVTCGNYIGLWGEYRNQRRPLVEEGYVLKVNEKLERLIDNLFSELQNSSDSDW